MRGALLLLFGAVWSTSYASFEMMLAVETYPQIGPGRVHRFDPENGVHLGTFGSGHLFSPGGIAVDQALGVAYVSDIGAVKKFNYNTGEYLGSFNHSLNLVSQMSLTPDRNLMLTGINGVQKVSATTGAVIRTVTPFINNLVAAAYETSNQYMLVTHNPNLDGLYVTYHALSDGLPFAFATLSTGATGQGFVGLPPGGLDYRNGRAIVTVGHHLTSQPTGNATTYAFSGSGSPLGITGTSALQTAGATGTRSYVTNPVFGHDDQAFFISRYPSGNHITRTFGSTGLAMDQLLPSVMQSSYFSQVAIVLAPEPSGLVGIALGAGWMLRRRRSRD